MAGPRDCLLYARFSTDRQNPLSCADQLREARRYAAAQGWQIVGEYQDAAVSGTRGRSDRAGWDELLAFVERGGLRAGGVVLTWDIDRWSRDWADGMIEALRLHKLGVNLADTKDGVLEQAGLAGKILLTLKVAGSAEFIDKLRRGVLRGLAAKREAGFWIHHPPYGYAIERRQGGSVLVEDPEQADVVRWLFREVAAGRRPPDLARDLNRRGVPTRRKSRWTAQSVRDICRSPAYLGLIPIYRTRRSGRRLSRHQIPRDEIRAEQGLHAPLVSPDEWEAAQPHLTPVPRAAGRPSARRPLSGAVVCATCGRRAYVTGGVEPWRYYRCGAYGSERCENRRLIRIDRLEAACRALARTALDDEDVIRDTAAKAVETEWRRSAAAAAARGPVLERIRTLEHQQERLLAALYDGAAPALINARLTQVQDELEAARERLGAAGQTVEPLSVDAVADELRRMIAGREDDLGWVQRMGAVITLPAGGAPVTIAVLGHTYQLDGC